MTHPSSLSTLLLYVFVPRIVSLWVCCSTSPYPITSRNCFWQAEGCPVVRDAVIPYRVYGNVSLVAIYKQTDGVACAEREITAWQKYWEANRERERESERAARECAHSTAVLSFFPSSFISFVSSVLSFFLSFFLSFSRPSFLLLTFGFCVLSRGNFSVYWVIFRVCFAYTS